MRKSITFPRHTLYSPEYGENNDEYKRQDNHCHGKNDYDFTQIETIDNVGSTAK